MLRAVVAEGNVIIAHPHSRSHLCIFFCAAKNIYVNKEEKYIFPLFLFFNEGWAGCETVK